MVALPYLTLMLVGLLFQVLFCPQMHCPPGKMLQILIKVTDLIQHLAAQMQMWILAETEHRGHCHPCTGMGKNSGRLLTEAVGGLILPLVLFHL